MCSVPLASTNGRNKAFLEPTIDCIVLYALSNMLACHCAHALAIIIQLLQTQRKIVAFHDTDKERTGVRGHMSNSIIKYKGSEYFHLVAFAYAASFNAPADYCRNPHATMLGRLMLLSTFNSWNISHKCVQHMSFIWLFHEDDGRGSLRYVNQIRRQSRSSVLWWINITQRKSAGLVLGKVLKRWLAVKQCRVIVSVCQMNKEQSLCRLTLVQGNVWT